MTKKAGIAHGIVWTPHGSNIIQIHTTASRGKGQVLVETDLGQACLDSINKVLEVFDDIEDINIAKLKIHISIPGPIDGPSASLAIYMSLYSAITKHPVNPHIAFMGEVTDNGMLLDVGGVQNKLQAAHRAKFNAVVIPFGNFRELPEHEPYKDLYIGGAVNVQQALVMGLMEIS